MPPKDNIRLDAGSFYVETPEGLKPILPPEAIESIELTEEPPELDIDGRTPPRIVQQSGEFSGTITLTEEASEALRKLAGIAEYATYFFKLLMDNIKKICESYPYRRSKYLVVHGSPLVRKKNVKRMVRYTKKLNKGGQR